MKKVLLLVLAIMLASPFLMAQTGENGEIIEIVIGEGGGDGDQPHRSLDAIPVEASYYSSLSSILLSFTENLGTIDVKVENLTTGWSIQTQANTAQGGQWLPIAGTVGDYEITITLPGGTTYYGYFEIE